MATEEKEPVEEEPEEEVKELFLQILQKNMNLQ